MTVVDAWKAYRFHLGGKHRHKQCALFDFVAILVRDMLQNTYSNKIKSQSALTITRKRKQQELVGNPSREELSLGWANQQPARSCNTLSPASSQTTTRPLAEIQTDGSKHLSNVSIMTDDALLFGIEHQLVSTELREMHKRNNGSNGIRIKRFKCSVCKKKTKWYCPTCPPAKGQICRWYCSNQNGTSCALSCQSIHMQEVQCANAEGGLMSNTK